MYGFSKLLTLPSNGLEYNKFCYLKPVTIEYFLFADDIESEILNRTELYVNILRKYVEIPVDITELYTYDLYFLWVNFITQILEDKYFLHSICSGCRHENKLAINLFDMSTDYYDNRDIYKTIEIQEKNTKITYRRRKVKDNLEFGIKNLISDNEFSIPQVAEFMASQITEIYCEDYIVEKHEHKEFLEHNLQNNDVADLFKQFIKQDFGVKNNLKYNCKKCNHENHTDLFNNYGNSLFITEREVANQKKEVFKTLLELSRTPVVKIHELMQLPYSSLGDMLTVMQEIKFEPII